MQVQVTKDNVCILKKDTVHKGEYNINNVLFEFSKEYTSDLVKVAIFKIKYGKSYQVSIINNQCDIPSEILSCVGEIMLGVYAYKISNEELELRYSPYPTYFTVIGGSYDPSAEESQEITPSQFEQYMQALQNGLTEVNAKLQEVINTSETLEENGTYAKKQGDYAKETTDELISKVENGDFNGATFTPSVSNDGDLSWSNDKGLDNPITVNIKGQKGDTGEPFTISKTYPSVEAMEADFDNMEVGDYVMIASSVDDEDNAKLYVKTDTEWVFITDFSGAIGIQGEPGVGIVSASAGNSSESDGYTITPITFMKTDNSQTTVNVSVKNGEQGSQGEQGIQGDTGVGISTVTAGTPIIDEEKTITPITFNKTDGSNQTVNVEAQNGETQDLSGYVTNDSLDNIVPKNDASGEDITIDDALEYKLFNFEGDGASEQVTTTGKNKIGFVNNTAIDNGLTITFADDNTITINGTSTTNLNKQYKILQDINKYVPDADYTAQIFYVGGSLNGSNERIQFCIRGGLTEDTGSLTVSGYVGASKSQNYEQAITQKSPSDEGYMTAVQIMCNEGITFDNLKLKFQFEEGSTSTEFEPYTGSQPSPSPDYPQEITTLTFDKITRCGKNLFDVNDTSSISDSVSIDDDGWINVNVDNSSGTNNKFANVWTYPKYNIKVNTSYKLVLEIKSHSGNNGYLSPVSNDNSSYSQFNNQYQYFFYNIVDNSISVYDILSQKSFDKAKTMLRTFVSCYAGEKLQITFRISVIENTSVTPQNFVYEPYQATEYAIDLQGNEMVELPNGTKDELVIDKYGNVSLVKNVGKIVLNGSEIWELSSFTNNTILSAYYNINTMKYLTTFITDRFKYVGSVSAATEYEYCSTGGQSIRIGINKSRLTSSDIDGFKQWLQENNVEVYYKLATPQTIPLGTLSELITTLNGTNNISINGNIPTIISTTYALDIKKYIDNKLAEISSAVIEEG